MASVRQLALAAALGVALGLFCIVGDGTSIRVINGLANATSPWLVVAFGAGALARRPHLGAAAGLVALVAAVATYYVGLTAAFSGRLADVRAQVVVWLVAALVAGPALGAAGGAWRSGAPRASVRGAAIVAGGLLAEGLHRLVALEAWTGIDLTGTLAQVAAVDLMAAIALPLLLLPAGSRLLGYVGAAGFGLLGLLALTVVTGLARGRFLEP